MTTERWGSRATSSISRGALATELFHQNAVEADHAAFLIHHGPGSGEDTPRLGQQHAHAQLLEDAQRHLVHRLDLIVGEDAQWREGIDEAAIAAGAARRAAGFRTSPAPGPALVARCGLGHASALAPWASARS